MYLYKCWVVIASETVGQIHGLAFDTELALGCGKVLVAGCQLALPPEQGCLWHVDGEFGSALAQCKIRCGPQVLASLVLNRSKKTEFSEQSH